MYVCIHPWAKVKRWTGGGELLSYVSCSIPKLKHCKVDVNMAGHVWSGLDWLSVTNDHLHGCKASERFFWCKVGLFWVDVSLSGACRVCSAVIPFVFFTSIFFASYYENLQNWLSKSISYALLAAAVRCLRMIGNEKFRHTCTLNAPSVELWWST